MSWFVLGIYYGLCGLGIIMTLGLGVALLAALCYGCMALFGDGEDKP